MEVSPSRDASHARKKHVFPMSFILAMHIQFEVVNIIAYIGGFLSIKTSQKISSANWHSHNDNNANIDVTLVSTVMILQRFLFQQLTESLEI